MSQAVKKKGGRPNRGGGRFNNRGGGGRGRGGGRGGSSSNNKSKRPSGPPSETGSKEGNFAAYDDDDVVLLPKQYEDPGRFNRRPMSSYQSKRGGGSKVKMQSLHMSDTNQELVRDVLRELHGEELGNIDEDGYNELDHRSEHQYWTTENTLTVQGVEQFGAQQVTDGSTYAEMVNKYALDNLLRYGFHREHCVTALQENDDVGAALEYLLKKCYDDDKAKQSKDKACHGEDVTMETALEQRQDEALALSSIYAEDFEEKIPNKLWTLQLDLNHFDEIIEKLSKQDEKKQKQQKYTESKNADVDPKDVCPFYLQGNCRYGSRCWKKHVTPFGSDRTTVDGTFVEEEIDGKKYELEVRFPGDNKYPFEAPLIAFSSRTSKFPIIKCLNISKRLYDESKTLAEDGEPAVFSLISILEDETQMKDVLSEKRLIVSLPKRFENKDEGHKFVCQSKKQRKEKTDTSPKGTSQMDSRASDKGAKNVDNKDQGGEEDESSSSSSDEEVPTTPEKPGKIFVFPRQNQKVIERDNRQLRENFHKKQHHKSYKTMLAQRQQLPAWKEQDNILDLLRDNQVVVVSGMTGCGKTTQVPQFILDASLRSANRGSVANVICTQPRRISAMSVAERVAKERATHLGGIVGYQIRLESKQSSSTRLLFCTTGILLRRLESDTRLEGVSHIIVDEVHERSEESDFLMMVLRDLLPKRRDLRVILMSATLNAELFSGYFDDGPVIEIPGKTFPVESFFLEDAIEMSKYKLEEDSFYSRPIKRSNAAPSENTARQLQKGNFVGMENEIEDALATLHVAYPEDRIKDWNLTVTQMALRYEDYRKTTIKTLATMDQDKINNDLIEELVKWIVSGKHEYPSSGAILIFLPGLAEITSLYEQLNASLCGPKAQKQYKIIPLHSSLSSEDQNAAFVRPKEGVTKIVIATNIAETSITIDDVVFVIDAGKMKEKRYDPSKGMESLDITWISKANAQQRRGRAGRVTEGVCFHLFTSHTYEQHLRDQPIPEIQRAPLEQLVLRIKLLDMFKGKSVKEVLERLLEPPVATHIDDAIHRLQDLGALNAAQDLTPLGYHLAGLPVDVRIGKLMLFGAIFRCLDPVLTIAASLSFRSPFVAPFDKRDQADKKRKEFAIGNSDHLTLLRAYKGWTTALQRSQYNGYRYCHENFLSIKTLQMIASMKHQFTELLSSIGFIKEGLFSKQMERMAGRYGDAVVKAAGYEANSNADNSKLVVAVLCAALYPNVVQVMTPETKYSQTSVGAVQKAPKPNELKFKTKDEGYIHIHPSSVNFQVRYYESPYLVYHEKVKTSKVYIRDCSMVSVYPLLLFGGCSLHVDMERGKFIISLDDGWIRFKVNSVEVAELVRELRLELDQLMADKISNPNMDLCTCPRGSRIITAIVQLITTQ
ncbi:putative ATP-dependent RNA helicase DHX57 [Amphiura filiformis]|uniref:putative ATP-dependent RNA helicase DHX57 n=1 Tax=Amphiura filiformis TaxID=82378 RepID=UPI003B219A45